MARIGDGAHVDHVEALLGRVQDRAVRRVVLLVEDLRRRELNLEPLDERPDAFVFQPAVDELLVLWSRFRLVDESDVILEFVTYPHKRRKAGAVVAHPEVLGLGSQLRQDVLEELGLLNEHIAQPIVVEPLALVEHGQLLAQWNSLLPALSLVEVVDDLHTKRTNSLVDQISTNLSAYNSHSCRSSPSAPTRAARSTRPTRIRCPRTACPRTTSTSTRPRCSSPHPGANPTACRCT